MPNSEAPQHPDSVATVQMQIDIAVLKQQYGSIDKKLDNIAVDLRDTYARKTDVTETIKTLKEDVSKIQNAWGWFLKIIFGIIITAIMGLIVLKGGGRL